MRTSISSERTRVPPVTAERSPPLSRITGADSPVIADSSTVAAPLTTSPSPGIVSPAHTTTMSPGRRSAAGTSSMLPSSRRTRPTAAVFAERSASACALPRPSATASARFANTTVRNSQIASENTNTLGLKKPTMIVMSAPISTINMTGVRTMCAGFNLRSACGSALARERGVKPDPEFAVFSS